MVHIPNLVEKQRPLKKQLSLNTVENLNHQSSLGGTSFEDGKPTIRFRRMFIK